jgi:hypothetical protein
MHISGGVDIIIMRISTHIKMRISANGNSICTLLPFEKTSAGEYVF